MLRPYWRNYFEQTDAIVWVVDSGDRFRMQDCKEELHSLLTEDVRHCRRHTLTGILTLHSFPSLEAVWSITPCIRKQTRH